jgi:hypothetical protein
MRRAIEACVEAGLVHSVGGKHQRITDPRTGRFVTVSGTPSDPMAYRQMLRDVRRHLGVEIEL